MREREEREREKREGKSECEASRRLASVSQVCKT